MFAGKKIAFIGGGKMGSILVRGMIRRRIAPSKSITVTDIDQPRLKELATSLKVQARRTLLCWPSSRSSLRKS